MPAIEFDNTWKSVDAPLWAWLNLLSIDAVAVGVCWNVVFTLEFCGRMPRLYEAAIIGLSIWLVYVGDRLLDSSGLDCRRRHTLRHRIHYEYRGRIVFAWLVALVADTALVVSFANETQLRWGFLAIGFLGAYFVWVHLIRKRSDWFPKELRAGLVFAFGVSLPGWVENSWSEFGGILAATLMTGILFAINCLVIACWERDSDRSQGFESFATGVNGADLVPGRILLIHWVFTLVLCNFGILSPRIAVSIVVGNCLLLLVLFLHRRCCRVTRPESQNPIPVNVFGLLADASLVLPTVVFVLLGSSSR